LNFDVPSLTDQLSRPFSVDGHRHFPIFIADNASLGSGRPLQDTTSPDARRHSAKEESGFVKIVLSFEKQPEFCFIPRAPFQTKHAPTHVARIPSQAVARSG
jgi:hypothetical protein